MAAPRHLFTYGTLRRGFQHPAARMLHELSVFIGEGSVSGILHDLGSYPGLVIDPDGTPVAGEIFELPGDDQLLFQALDEYEGSEYRREAHAVALHDGQTCLCWIYVYHPPLVPRDSSRR